MKGKITFLVLSTDQLVSFLDPKQGETLRARHLGSSQGGHPERAGGGDQRATEEDKEECPGTRARSKRLLLHGQPGPQKKVCFNDGGRGRAGSILKCRGGVHSEDGQGRCMTK